MIDADTFDWIGEAEAKTERAIALVKQMVAWSLEKYEDPVEHTPYCSAEGGYQCELYDARAEIEGHFSQADGFSEAEWEEILTATVDEVEADGTTDWTEVIVDAPEAPAPDDEGDPTQFLQQSLQNLESLKEKFRYFGPADERCSHCGGPVETFLDKDGRNPMRCCWRCEMAAIERENGRLTDSDA